MSTFEPEKDSTFYRNQHFEYGKEVDTTDKVIIIKEGQDTEREYVLPYAVSRDIVIKVNGVAQTVSIRNLEGSTATTAQ
jgi:hypothetical protein